MKVVHIPDPPPEVCGCWAKLDDYRLAEGTAWPVGTKVQCDCGRKYELSSLYPVTWKHRPTRWIT